MSIDIKKLTLDQIIHVINETDERIWEDDTLTVDIDFRMMRYIMHRLKSAFFEALEDDEPEPVRGSPTRGEHSEREGE
jgi:hypothetical protein